MVRIEPPLIECTLDDFLGWGCVLGSIALDEGCWPGHNYLGVILVRVGTQLILEVENNRR